MMMMVCVKRGVDSQYGKRNSQTGYCQHGQEICHCKFFLISIINYLFVSILISCSYSCHLPCYLGQRLVHSFKFFPKERWARIVCCGLSYRVWT